ncbi:energy-coupling factor transporter transmembrane component T family protein [Nocardia sp. CDC160]|uniref:energy-coupling factor transporter transmembrane component T family protein n=1 Tax=Nocardia sp. CDC160 TaxID=3112166 RepID=UPI002DB6D168|nr:energy-coupling factor transporter transmembrane protein EcfT [Nocardia sp. CDC160]MEC3913472.1 energy-coupling factor transporter transmembrane protein EcfT [Nocardia sp. CDC160]
MSSVVLREVPVDSPVHRLWAGTKMIGVFAFSLLLMFIPSWWLLGLATAFLIGVFLLAKLPLGTLPRFPWVVWIGIAIGAAINAPVGASALLRYAQVVLFGFLLLGSSFLVAWTTPMGEIAPALAKLGAPLKKIGWTRHGVRHAIPVDEWAVVVALTLRGLPLLLEEMRILRAARKLRPKDSLLHRAAENPLVDILTASMAVSTRRAGELGEAITTRGGTGELTARPGAPGRADAVALLVVALMCGLGAAVELLF